MKTIATTIETTIELVTWESRGGGPEAVTLHGFGRDADGAYFQVEIKTNASSVIEKIIRKEFKQLNFSIQSGAR